MNSMIQIPFLQESQLHWRFLTIIDYDKLEADKGHNFVPRCHNRIDRYSLDIDTDRLAL